MKDHRKFWNKSASRYDEVEEKDMVVYERIFEEIKPYLNKESYVLDIGCGTGALHEQISTLVHQIVGVDYSEKMIEVAKGKAATKNLSNVKYICGTLNHNSIKENSYNIVTAFYLLHLFEDLASELGQIRGLLGDHGYFVSVTPCMKESVVLGTLLGFSGAVGITPKIKKYSYKDLAESIKKSGFNIVDIKPMRESTHEYLIVAQKV